ncbi:hypothetical protein AAKU61_000371 [Undibacterium sp. GrIS 1.2]|uniref:hypothetical protein n=1 Tax=Undibacterium sp. GrIS 1.2 TaxID=3143933 RepID=UPI003397A643
MTKAVGYCVELERNITLEEAHIEFFKQPEGKRKRFTFWCGDPKCRNEKITLVVAALYDRVDAFGEKFKSPYFRGHAAYPHIATCTWITRPDVKTSNSKIKKNIPASKASSVVASSGFVFDPRGKKSSSSKPKTTENEETLEPKERNGSGSGSAKGGDASDTQRPTTSKFMLQVAVTYLSLTEHARKDIPLEIKNIAGGNFYSICIPVLGFHPSLQRQRIYRGKVSIVELDYVYLLKFHSKIRLDGKKTSKTTSAEIKLTKKWLNENDRALMGTLNDVVEANAIAWCFFYTTHPIQVTKTVARFEIDDPNLIAVVPEWDIPEKPETLGD